MKSIRCAVLALLSLVVAGAPAFAEQQPPLSLSPALAQALVNAKSVYIVTGHVRYYKTKAFVKSELVDSTPFAEPTQSEMEKWGRFKIVSDPKQADLILRVYMTGNTQSMPVVSAYVTGSVNVGSTYTVLDVIQPSSNKVLWIGSKNEAHTWSTKTGVAGLVKEFREFLEQQEAKQQKIQQENAQQQKSSQSPASISPISSAASSSASSRSQTQ
jgi:hypothetical protein